MKHGNGAANGSSHSHPALSSHELRRVSVDAGCDPRQVIKYLRDQPIVANAIPRIEKALTVCGYARLVKPSQHARRDSTPPTGS